MGKAKQQAPAPPPGVSDGDVKEVKQEVKQQEVKQPEAIEVKETTTQTVTGGKVSLTVPVLILSGYCARRVDVRMSGAEAAGWKAVAQGLEQQEERLKDGKFVRTSSDAVRWVGEQFAGGLG